MKTGLPKSDDVNMYKEMVDVDYLLSSLGFDITKSSGRELRAPCIIHGGDNKSAFRFDREKRTWICFTHQCHDVHGYDILSLIMAVQGSGFKEALNFLKELVGDTSAYKKNLELRKFKKDKDKFMSQYSTHQVPEYVNESHLSSHRPFRSNFFINEGFPKNILDHFEVSGGFADSFGVVRDIIPIRNVKNNLVAYSLRDIRKNGDKDFKYVLSEGFQKDKVLYNLNNARLFGPEVPLIVVEGFKSVWKFHEYGFYNTVAIMGSSITPGQLNLLKAYALKGVVLMLDPDKAGVIGMQGLSAPDGKVLKEGAHSLISKFTDVHSIYMDSALGEDPAELTLEQVYGYLNEYIR